MLCDYINLRILFEIKDFSAMKINFFGRLINNKNQMVVCCRIESMLSNRKTLTPDFFFYQQNISFNR
jgi:hypothetical protein